MDLSLLFLQTNEYTGNRLRGFIGFHVSLHLLKNQKVLGIDNINNYYDTRLKIDRLKILKKYKNFVYKKVDISNNVSIKKIFNIN